MKYTTTLGICLFVGITTFSGVSLAGEGWHSSSDKNPHAKGSCASKKDKVAQMHKFHGKDWKHADSEKKVDANVDINEVKKTPRLEDYI